MDPKVLELLSMMCGRDIKRLSDMHVVEIEAALNLLKPYTGEELELATKAAFIRLDKLANHLDDLCYQFANCLTITGV